jgi:transposase
LRILPALTQRLREATDEFLRQENTFRPRYLQSIFSPPPAPCDSGALRAPENGRGGFLLLPQSVSQTAGLFGAECLKLASAEGRLPESVYFAECDVFLDLGRARSVHKVGNGHNCEALKREIVAALFAAGSSVSIVARQYDVNANQVFNWRKRYREESGSPSDPSAPQLIPVRVTAEQVAVAAPSSIVSEKIEIDVGGKYRVGIGGSFDGQALRRVLDVLERR